MNVNISIYATVGEWNITTSQLDKS